jgi:hypothetical protein
LILALVGGLLPLRSRRRELEKTEIVFKDGLRYDSEKLIQLAQRQ